MKKTKTLYFLASILFAALSFTACTEDNSMALIETPKKNNPVSDPVIRALSKVPGVYGISVKHYDTSELEKDKIDKTLLNDSVYIFYVEQPVDYKDPSMGYYSHRCKLRFKDFDKNVVVYTNGYDMYPSVTRPHDLALEFDANELYIEHRYFGESLPENFEDVSLTYLNADQQAHNIHNIVSALRSTIFTQGKWISTGTSKCGITTALQAYYSDMYGWKDIDVFVPFCAPFINGITFQDGSFCCDDNIVGTYLWETCGNGYEKGSTEQIAYERLRKIPYYICTNEKIRQAANHAMSLAAPTEYVKIIKQYNDKSTLSTGDLTKDITAFSINLYYILLYRKFSYVNYSKWASLVPDPELLASDEATQKDFDDFEKFISMDEEAVEKALKKNQSATRSAIEDHWDFLEKRRQDTTAPYEVQAYKELGGLGIDYSLVDGQYLTAQQCFNVNYILTKQYTFERTYTQDKGQLMRDFNQWVKTESTMPIVFVYAYNDPWTGAGITPDKVKDNPMVTSIIDYIAVHNHYIRDPESFMPESRQAIVGAINKFLK